MIIVNGDQGSKGRENEDKHKNYMKSQGNF